MFTLSDITFIDNNAAIAKPDRFVEIHIDTRKAVESWRLSLFSFEWLRKDGSIKAHSELAPKDQAKREAIENLIERKAPIAKPVLGLGIEDNVEIGSGRDVLLTLCDMGVETLPVHVLKTHLHDFSFLRRDDEA